MDIRFKDIITWTKGEIVKKNFSTLNLENKVGKFCTDSRRIKDRELFVAIRGENFDGNDFVVDALQKGAIGAIFEKHIEIPDQFFKKKFLIRVKDSVEALGNISRRYRRKLKSKIIAITGSNGKTTTKSLIHSILSKHFSCTASPASFNNQIGVPLTLLSSQNDDYIITEVGTNQPGDIKYLAEIVNPDAAVIISVGPAHLEGLKTINNIAREKSDLIRFVHPNGYVFLNYDNKYVRNMSNLVGRNQNLIYFGSKYKCPHIYAEIEKCELKKTTINLKIKTENEKTYTFDSRLFGNWNLYNILAAISTSYFFARLSVEKIIKGVKDFQPEKMRTNVIETSYGITIIDDTYNANPLSMKSILEFVSRLEVKGKRFAVLGDMLELGSASKRYHNFVGSLTKSLNFDFLATFGEYSLNIYKKFVKNNNKGKGFFFEKKEDIVKFLLKEMRPGDLIVVKGSRKMKMEEIVQELCNRYKN